MPDQKTREFVVEVQQLIFTEVRVKAHTASEAADTVDKASFPLPPRHQWHGSKSLAYIVINAKTGEEELERS